MGTGMGEAAKAAAEKAAQAITMSVTPTALSWALVSLLADGGGGMPEGSGGGGEGEGGRKRGQGHLLPRSRDKYPTPVSRGGGVVCACVCIFFPEVFLQSIIIGAPLLLVQQ